MKARVDLRRLTADERKMVRRMTDFTLDNPRHRPWETLVEASRKEIEQMGKGKPWAPRK